MRAKHATSSTRPSGALRYVVKRARGKEYPSWQWRTHRRGELGWEKVDLELGSDLTCLRTRVYVALGELKAPLLVERWARRYFKSWSELPTFTGIKGKQEAAWWCELPKQKGGNVKLRFRSLQKGYDFRRVRAAIAEAEDIATSIWEGLTADPVERLALMQWFESAAQKEVEAINSEALPRLRKLRRQGELNQRDFEADERDSYRRLEGWESMLSTVRGRWDELLSEMVKAMPRGRQEELRKRIVVLADRMAGDGKQLQEWSNRYWDGKTLRWEH